MKKIVLLSVLLLAVHSVFCQVSFENLSFDAALQRSKETGKLIFLQFESDGCGQCNEVADKAFENKKLTELLEQIFICVKITVDHPDRNKIASRYNKKEASFGSMFISADGTLIHNYPGSTTLINTYQEHIDKALTKAGEGMRISTLEKEYVMGNRNPLFLEDFLLAKKTLYLETDSLLDEYITLLPPDSLKSVRTLLFIAQMAPVLDSKADMELRRNYAVFTSAWSQLKASVRVAVNYRIVYKSMRKAIHEKNVSYAYRVADFRRRTYVNNLGGGQKAYDFEMINYYRETNDTLNYFIRSVNYYDQYFMTVTVDSVKKRDSLTLKMLLAMEPAPQPAQNGVSRKTVKYSPVVQYYNRELNNAAFVFYEMTNDPLYLAKAIQWSARANEFFEHYISLNTHALLLYKAGKKEEALAWQSKAIELKKKRGFDTKNLEKELSGMKAGKPAPL
ncbi:MAG: thioredoxin family protein [Ferruginibacter sp.]|nr:thioredoxin family protein [Chitinophagaceae bacterium]